VNSTSPTYAVLEMSMMSSSRSSTSLVQRKAYRHQFPKVHSRSVSAVGTGDLHTWLDRRLMVGDVGIDVKLPNPRCVMTTLAQ
jgi:uncharacterized protein YcbX